MKIVKLIIMSSLIVSNYVISMEQQSVVPPKQTIDLAEISNEEISNEKVKDPISQELWADSIQEKQAKDLGFIIAMVETQVANGKVYHYFDAAYLNKYLFDTTVPGSNTKRKKWQDPTNRQPIVHIFYYLLYPQEKTFEYIGNENDFSNETHPLFTLFLSNLQRGIGGEIESAILYYKLNNFKRAKYYLDQTIKYPSDESDKSLASYYLGLIYYEGQGVTQDLSKARSYFQQALELTDQEKQKDVRAKLREIDEREERVFSRSW